MVGSTHLEQGEAAAPASEPRRRRLGRLVGLAAGLTAAIAACVVVPPWLSALVPAGGVVALLVSLEAAYVALLSGAVVGCLVLGALLARARRRRARRPWVARGLLLCGSCVVMFACAEVGAAAWLAWTHRMPTLPAEKAGANRTAAATRANATSGSGNRGGKREVTLAVLGESSAVGFPFQDWLNAGEIVAWQLRQALPGQTFHTELVAVPGHTLEQQHKKLLSLREIPDVLIIYCGHNEFAAPTPSGREVNHYLDTQTQSRFAIVGDVLARESPLCRLFQETTDQYRVHQVPLRDKKRPLVDVPSYTPAEYAARLANFARRLEAIVVRCERTGTLPVLVIPPANDGGYEPNRSFLAPGTPRAEREAFAAAFLSAREAESHDRAGSEAKYRALLDRQPGFAEAHFRLARLLEQGGSWDEAHTHYVQARDLDGHPVRCLTAFQDVYREVAARHGCILVDGQALFRKAGMHRLLDDHLFNDAMHPSLRGHIALAQGVLDALHARGALGLPADTPPPRIDPAASALHFGLNPAAWVTVCERAVMFYVAMAAQRYDPSERLGKCALYGAASRKIAAGAAPESVGRPGIGVPQPLGE